MGVGVGVVPQMSVCVDSLCSNFTYLEKECLICRLGRLSLAVGAVAQGEVRDLKILTI